jgi:FtsP/CotA-like multicopper oxidase with cupredoxin domain
MLGLGALGALSACTASSAGSTAASGGPPVSLASGDLPAGLRAAIAAAEAKRARSGRTTALRLTAQPVQIDLAGTTLTTWAYSDAVPGLPLQARVGDLVAVDFHNGLPEATSVHWHGLAIRNDMDGVPGVTTLQVPTGAGFRFSFVVPDAGTYWLHPHHGMQMDRGLYAPFIIEDPDEKARYDAEWVLVLDDCTDGVGRSAEQILAGLKAGATGDGGSMAGMDHMSGIGGMGSGIGGGPGMAGMMMGAGDVDYPLYLVNGHSAADPDLLVAKPGDRVRLRIINAGADTIFTVALGGHRLTVTHADGHPVTPATTAALTIGMGERYDAVVTLVDGVFPFVAEPVGKNLDGTKLARALIRTSRSASAPASAVRPAELDGPALTADRLSVAPGAALPRHTADRVLDVVLGGSMNPYQWTINGRTYDQATPLTIEPGQAGRLRIRNHTMMPHPIHLHGHTFQLGPAGGTGPRKDTVLFPPMGGVDADLVADNPGDWILHCHNAYHAETGMMTRLDYSV